VEYVRAQGMQFGLWIEPEMSTQTWSRSPPTDTADTPAARPIRRRTRLTRRKPRARATSSRQAGTIRDLYFSAVK
jgi:hypothetical protein